jgi:hypothetical protein
MSTELTDKTMVVVSKLGDFWVTPERANKVMAAKTADPQASIQLDGNLLACHTIDGVVTAEQYDLLNIKRRGAWQCKHQKWHERGTTCAHGQLIRK